MAYRSLTPSSSLAVVVPGFIYGVLSDASVLDGFIVCKAVTVMKKEFQAVLYKKIVSDSSDEVCYEETIFSYILNMDLVIGQLLSARHLDKLLYVNAIEIEELYISSIDLNK